MDPSVISNYYLQQGVLGVTIVVLAGVVVWQQKRIDSKEKELREMSDLRLKDSKDYTSSYTSTVEKYATLSEKNVTSDSLIMQAVNGIATLLQNKLK